MRSSAIALLNKLPTARLQNQHRFFKNPIALQMKNLITSILEYFSVSEKRRRKNG